MFLQSLTKDEKKAFFALAKKVIRSDKRIKSGELEILKMMKKEMAIKDTNEFAKTSINKLLHVFQSRTSKMAVLFELLGICYADGKFCMDEKNIIDQIRKAFDISAAEMAFIENWIVRQMALVNEAQEFFNS